MEADKAMRESAGPPVGWSRSLGLVNPLRAAWWLLTSIRFAIVLLALLAVIALVGVVVPQKPLVARLDSVAEADWLAGQEDTFGPLTDPMDALGLFDIFHQDWFAILLAITVASTGAYIVSRTPATWRAISRPRKRVPDGYFDSAPIRFRAEGSMDVDRFASVLRRKLYKVEHFPNADATYLFADRFQWAQVGTLFTHGAVALFIFAAVVSRMDSFSSPLFLSEGSTLPVFPVKDPGQIQVELENAHAAFAPDGQPLDYRADLVIYDRGEEVLRCSSTINSPCSYQGYHFYQSAYFGFGAALQVKNVATGDVIYRETLALAERSPSPRVRISDSGGDILLDDVVLLTESVDTPEGPVRAGIVRLDGGRPVTFWLRGDDRLEVFEPGTGEGRIRATLREGGSASSGDVQVAYLASVDVPTAAVEDLPLNGGGGSGAARLQLTNVVFGASETSSGDDVGGAVSIQGDPTLTLVGLQAQPVALQPGESATIGDLEYTFLGNREFAGIEARRDRSDTLVWLGAALMVVGMIMTFWVPRRRLWAKISHAGVWLAGQAPSHARYVQELEDLVKEAGSPATSKDTDD
jgi:cytochrome c biogenesis protein